MNLEKSPHVFHKKLRLLSLLVPCLFLVVLGGYYRIQILEQERYEALGKKYRIKKRRVKATRGLIYDRKGKLLTQNLPTYNLVLLRDEMKEPWHSFSEKLAPFIQVPVEDLDQKYTKYRYQFRSLPIVLKEDVDRQEVFKVLRHQLRFPGLSIEISPNRYYEEDYNFTHVLGYVGEVSAQNLRLNPEWKMGDKVGKEGLEKYYNDYLLGVDGERTILIDNQGVFQSDEMTKNPIAGGDLHLTLDIDLQKEAVAAMGENQGAIIVMNTKSGEILAYVSAPTYDLNRFSRRFTQKEWDEMLNAPGKPFLNRPVEGTFAPGSIFKLVTAISALDNGIINEDTRFYCSGKLRYYSHDFHCHNRSGHGELNLREAIQSSCNVYFYSIARELTANQLADTAKKLGLGAHTGIDIVDEKMGLVPSPEWKKENFGNIWFPGETLSMSIGQGSLQTTPVQMVQLMGFIANGGRTPVPHFLMKIVKGGITTPYQAPEKTLPKPIQGYFDVIRAGMWDVVNLSNGTGSKAMIPGLDVCGKTGTAQLRSFKTEEDRKNTRYLNAWFAGFAPRDNPEIAVVVLVEHALAGGADAAPIAKQLFEAYFASRREDERI